MSRYDPSIMKQASDIFGALLNTTPKESTYFSEEIHNPVFGAHGFHREPQLPTMKINIPVQPNINPTNTSVNVITRDVNFWEAYRAQKAMTWGCAYDPNWQLTKDSYLYKNRNNHLRRINITTKESKSNWNPIVSTYNGISEVAWGPKFSMSVR